MDKTKWKSVIVQVATHEKIRDLAHFQKLPINHVLERLVDEAWNKIYGPRTAPSPYLDQAPKGVFRSKA